MTIKRFCGNRYLWLVSAIIAAAGYFPAPGAVASEMQSIVANPAPIGPPGSAPRAPAEQREFAEDFDLMTPAPLNTFEGIDIDQNAQETGYLIIPPIPSLRPDSITW